MSFDIPIKIAFEVAITITNACIWFAIGRNSAKEYTSSRIAENNKENAAQMLHLVNRISMLQIRLELLDDKVKPIIKEFSPMMNLKK